MELKTGEGKKQNYSFTDKQRKALDQATNDMVKRRFKDGRKISNKNKR